MIRLFVVIIMLAVISGCNVKVLVTGGGNVISASGARDCAGGSVCEFQIDDANFNETFTAIPKEGYRFLKWQEGQDYWCANSTASDCVVTTVGTAGNHGVEGLIASDRTIYVQPIFELITSDLDGDGVKDHLDDDQDGDGVPDAQDGCPSDPVGGCAGRDIYETVLVMNREWAQPYLFNGVTGQELLDACPDRICSGHLAGWNLDGWIWASLDDMRAFFSHFANDNSVFTEYPSNQGQWLEIDYTLWSFAEDVFKAGFSPTTATVTAGFYPRDIWALIYSGDATQVHVGVVASRLEGNNAPLLPDTTFLYQPLASPEYSEAYIGAWLYRPVQE